MLETRILVTGANGFVGRALCRELAQRSVQYRAVVRDRAQNGEIALGDFDERTDWAKAIEGCTAVIHLANRAHILHETAENALDEFRRTNVKATINLARSAASGGANRFVYVSSIGVNGVTTPRHKPFLESDVPNPCNDYARSKWEAECALREIEAQTGLDVVIVRPPLVYGGDAPGNFALMVHALRRGMPLPFGSIENARSFVYVRNLTDALILCASHRGAAGNTFLVADNEEISTTDLLRQLANAMHIHARLFPCPTTLLRLAAKLAGRTDMVSRLLDSLRVDNDKIRRELGWRPPYTLQQGLADTAREIVQNNEKSI